MFTLSLISFFAAELAAAPQFVPAKTNHKVSTAQ
jgi:hypothetical protein